MSFVARLRGSTFLRDSAVLQVAAGAKGVAALASTLALAHLLGSERQGEYYLAVASWSFLWIAVNLGLYNVAVSQIAAAAARGNDQKIASWIAWTTKASLVVGLCASVIGWLGLPAFTAWAFSPGQIGAAALVLACTPLFDLPRVVVNAALHGTRRMGALARVEVGQELTRVFLVVTGAFITGDAMGPAVGSLLASGLGSVISIEAYRRECRTEGSLLPRLRDLRGRLRDVPVTLGLRLGLRLGLVRNFDAYGMQILPSMILGIFGDKAWVAYLRMAQRFLEVARTLMSGINRTALSHFSGLVGTQRMQGLESAYWRASLASGALMTTALLISLPVVPWMIEYFPADYRDPVWLCYRILLPGVIVVSFSVANDTFYLVTNTLKVALVLQAVCLVFGTGLIALLAWRWPTVGTPIGLSLNFAGSLLHVGYAALWFRRRRRIGTDSPAT